MQVEMSRRDVPIKVLWGSEHAAGIGSPRGRRDSTGRGCQQASVTDASAPPGQGFADVSLSAKPSAGCEVASKAARRSRRGEAGATRARGSRAQVTGRALPLGDRSVSRPFQGLAGGFAFAESFLGPRHVPRLLTCWARRRVICHPRFVMGTLGFREGFLRTCVLLAGGRRLGTSSAWRPARGQTCVHQTTAEQATHVQMLPTRPPHAGCTPASSGKLSICFPVVGFRS